jgi:hypothetical protein
MDKQTELIIAVAIAVIVIYLWYTGKLNGYLPASLQHASSTSGYCPYSG